MEKDVEARKTFHREDTQLTLSTFDSFSITTHESSLEVSKPATGTCFPLTIPLHGREWPSPVLAPRALPPRPMRGNRND